MKNRVFSILLVTMLALSMGLVSCGGGQPSEYNSARLVTMSVTSHTLTVAVNGSGSTSPPVGQHTYMAGTNVSINATPSGGYRFVQWTGDVGTIGSLNATSTTITMNGDYSITANFEEAVEYTITITSGADGHVTNPGEGTFTYYEGTTVDLVAVADQGYQFGDWTGDVASIACVNAALTTITMQGNYSITANFEEDQVVTFPDPNLEAAIRQAINKPDGSIYASDLDELIELNASSKGVSDLTGLEHCTSLTRLSFYGNPIGDISPVAHLTNLTYLTLGSNQITDISAVAGLTNLRQLGFHDNQISDISPVAGLTKLTHLWLRGNQISDISAVAGLTNLYGLQLQYNQISDISPLASVSGLDWFDLSGNQISDISPLANLINLDWFYLTGNRITDITPLAHLINTRIFHLEDNQISDVSPLLQNEGLGWWRNHPSGMAGLVFLTGNPLSCDSICIYIPQLLAREVWVAYDPQGCETCGRVGTATDTGFAYFMPSHGFIEDLQAIPPHSLPSVTFPHGMFSFRITGLPTGQTVTLTVELPSPVPVGTVWWKCDNGRWHSLPNLSDDGDNTMVIQFTDGGVGDSDSIPGQITDPGGPGNPMTVGWETLGVDKTAVAAPWIALLAAIMAGGSLLVLRRRRVLS